MNRFLGRLYYCLAILFACLALLVALDLQALGWAALRSKTFLMMVTGAGFFALAGWRFSVLARLRLFLLIFSLVTVEIFLQAACWFGLLKGINTKEYLPWGRVYWTGEGLGNSIRNRYAWHCPEFDLTRTNRIAIIGDSFVEAVEVHRTRNLGSLLRTRVEAERPGATVLPLGEHGVGPAHYLEILKYAQRHFGIREAVVSVYLGNDITDCSSRLQFHDPREFVSYTLDANGALTLDATGVAARAACVQGLEARHRSPGLFLPRILVSHCMMVQLPVSVAQTLARNKKAVADAAHVIGPETPLARIGLKGAPFAVEPSPEAREAMSIMEAILGEAQNFAQAHGIRLSIVTVPFFPPNFYEQRGTDWTPRLGEYDFLGPDRELQAWAAKRDIPLLSLGQAMRQRGLTTEEIRALYLSNGSGHFSEAGHRFAAESIDDALHPGGGKESPVKPSAELPQKPAGW